MKINFHILDGIKIGGIENLALTLSSEKISMEKNYLINLNENVNNYSNYFSKNKKYKNLKIISIERKKGILVIPFIIKLFSKSKPHKVIIYFNNINSLWVVLGAKISGTNNLAICVQNAIKKLSNKDLKLIFLMRIFNLLNVRLVPCSKAIRDSFLNFNNKIKFSEVIPNCINVKSFQNEVLKNRKFKKTNSIKTIVMVARLDEIKDQETLLKAYAKIHKKCNLILVGDGNKRVYLEGIANELGLNIKKIFVGSKLDITAILAKADIFAFSTTLSEGFGIALIEAMAARLPIIATDVPACREVLDDGKAGILIPAGRVDLWINALNQIISSSTKRDFYIEKSIQNLKKYDVKIVKHKWINLFK
tara:strand:+ start:749 stop:1837 length:1089 start_codon:yes stop_codon:yes gene_type:complete